ncbi:ATP-binding cassette domain-containing protein [Sphingomonas sp. ST-64]|uniref:ATP-binding cassette domain-containing protein n=1 Tax=Sphingomonas plantiphila TaxID=3163295 RepID=A0ABW8YK86_9SPHN
MPGSDAATPVAPLPLVGAVGARHGGARIGAMEKFYQLLTRDEKRRGLLLLAMAAMMAILETVGVASIMPFLAVLGDTSLVASNPALAAVYDFMGRPDMGVFLTQLGIASFVVVLSSAGFRIVTNYFLNDYTEMMRHSLSERLLETYLRQPYEFFIQNNSSDLAKSILSEVDQITQNFIRPLIQLVSYGVVATCIVAFLLILDFAVAVIVLGVIGGSYVAIFLAVNRVLGRVGRERVAANRERYSAASEALGGIKAIKLLGRESAYLSRFQIPSIRQSKTQAINTTVAQLPKFLIEAIGFGGVIALALGLLITKGGSSSSGLGQVLPVLGIYAFAGLRLLPAAQNMYSSAANMRFGFAALNEIHFDMRERQRLAEIQTQAPERMRVSRSIRFDGISYRYPGAARDALAGITLEIPVGCKIGLVGTTGCGKTTLVDLLLGLLKPSEGDIRVDDVALNPDNLGAWQQALGYVQQDIFLADTTLVGNIALGVDPNSVDRDHAIRCAEIADLAGFVIAEMPWGYDTMVGERGVRLSGGQRQRIGIARALYRKPQVLILDEATSALDNQTEQTVMNAIYRMGDSVTAVIIAHRLSTVRACDQIYLLDKGSIRAHGTYDELIATSAEFRQLAQHVS